MQLLAPAGELVLTPGVAFIFNIKNKTQCITDISDFSLYCGPIPFKDQLIIHCSADSSERFYR
jgi:hypothetical protein